MFSVLDFGVHYILNGGIRRLTVHFVSTIFVLRVSIPFNSHFGIGYHKTNRFIPMVLRHSVDQSFPFISFDHMNMSYALSIAYYRYAVCYAIQCDFLFVLLLLFLDLFVFCIVFALPAPLQNVLEECDCHQVTREQTKTVTKCMPVSRLI